MATQLFKLGLGFFIAAPKAILTALGTPFLFNFFENQETNTQNRSTNININFKGKNNLPQNIGKLIDKSKLQDFVIKNKDSNFPVHIIAATDTLATATFVQQIRKSKKLEDKYAQLTKIHYRPKRTLKYTHPNTSYKFEKEHSHYVRIEWTRFSLTLFSNKSHF